MGHKDAAVRLQTLQSLSNYASVAGKDITRALVGALTDTDVNVRRQALTGLQATRDDLQEALPHVAPLLKSEDVPTRHAALNLLGRMGPEATPHLLSALKNSNPQTRWLAAATLRTQPKPAKEAVPALVEAATRDDNPTVRTHAVHALLRSGPESVPHFVRILKSEENPGVRLATIQALANLGPAAKEAAPLLIAALKDSMPAIRWTSARALGNVGESARAAVPALEALLKDANSTVRNAAKTALGQIGGR
jgi:HEAT repeat protein